MILVVAEQREGKLNRASWEAIAGAQLLRGHTLEDSVQHGLLWSVITAAVFTGVRIYKSRRGQYCAVCGDTPATPAPAEGDRPAVDGYASGVQGWDVSCAADL